MISVCMATYNGEKYIAQQIESILSQLSYADELVISDDGSTDSTVDIIHSFNDRRIKFIPNPGPKHGINANFENALSNASGDILFLSDQDDVWLPGKVEACVAGLNSAACVVHDTIITDDNLKILDDSFFRSFNCRTGFIHNWIRNGYLGCAMAFKRDILKLALPFPPSLPVWQDIWIGSLAQLNGGVKFINHKGIMFRRHNSTSSVTFKKRLPISKMISTRISILYLLFNRQCRKKG